jgi:large conductance mechanosensitive channel
VVSKLATPIQFCPDSDKIICVGDVPVTAPPGYFDYRENTMSMMKEFRDFAMRGNVMDMAIGIVIGGAFGKIVSSFVNDVLMPPLGLAIGGVNFSELSMVLQEASGEVAAVTMNYGSFIQTVVDFVIIAFAIFMVVKAMNSMKKKEEAKPAAPPKPSAEETLLTEIRDLMRDR